MVYKGHRLGSRLLVPWGGAQPENSDCRGTGTPLPGHKGRSREIMVETEFKTRGGQVEARRRWHSLWVEKLGFEAGLPGWNPDSTTFWLYNYWHVI